MNKVGKYEIQYSNPNSNVDTKSYVILDRPTGEVLHKTSNYDLAQFLHKKYNMQGYCTIVLESIKVLRK